MDGRIESKGAVPLPWPAYRCRCLPISLPTLPTLPSLPICLSAYLPILSSKAKDKKKDKEKDSLPLPPRLSYLRLRKGAKDKKEGLESKGAVAVA